jgi:hypothetical protein
MDGREPGDCNSGPGFPKPDWQVCSCYLMGNPGPSMSPLLNGSPGTVPALVALHGRDRRGTLRPSSVPDFVTGVSREGHADRTGTVPYCARAPESAVAQMSCGCGPIFGIAAKSSSRRRSLFSAKTRITSSWLTGPAEASPSRPTS